MNFKCAIILLFVFLGGNSIFAQRIRQDSIQQIVNSMPDTSRLPYLAQKIKENNLSASKLPFARILYQEATKQQNEEYIADAIFSFARHFYAQNYDSLLYWTKQAEPIYIRLGRLEDICRLKAWCIYDLSNTEQKEEVLSAVSELKEFGKKINFPQAQEMADQAMADFYFKNDLPEDGERLYLSVLKQLKNRNAPMIKSFNIYRHLSLRASERENRLNYLHLAEDCLAEAKNLGLAELDAENPIHVLEYVIYRTYSNEYLKTGEYEHAWEYLQKADSLTHLYQMERGEKELIALYFNYYLNTGDLDKALEYSEKKIIQDQQMGYTRSYLESLEERALVLDRLGRYRDAYELSVRLLHAKDSISQNDFHQTLADVRTKYEVEHLEFEKQRMEEKASQTRQQMTLLGIGCFVLFLIILGLIQMIRIIQRNRKELRVAKEKAEEADQLKSTFLANMNHEIRTPLNAIVGFSQVLIDEEDKENRREFAEIIESNNELLQRLIGDILDLSKIDSNSMSLIYSQQDIPTVMKEIYNMISLRTPTEIELILDPCEPLVMNTDRNRLVQIITNLLTNAIKHTSRGHIRFGYKLSGNNIKFYIEDTGKGIPSEQLESIFDRFTQLESERKGVGLGLAICKGLTIKMGGRIWVESAVGKGSIFFVEVPIG